MGSIDPNYIKQQLEGGFSMKIDLSDVSASMLVEVSKKWRMKPKEILEEHIQEIYSKNIRKRK